MSGSVYGKLMELNAEQQPRSDDVSKKEVSPAPPVTNLSKKPKIHQVIKQPTVQKTATRLKEQPKPINKSKQPRYHDTMQPLHHDTVIPRYHDTVIETIRKATKEFGKEAATYRFTLEEKKVMADLIYTFRREDMKTSENQITRIGLNFALEDYRLNGENSVLYRVLKALSE